MLSKRYKILAVVVVSILISLVVYTIITEKYAIDNLTVSLESVKDVELSCWFLIIPGCAYIDLELKFDNPTGYDTPAFRTEFDIYLNDAYVGFASLPSTTVRSHSSTLSVLTIYVEFADILGAIITAIIDWDFTISIEGVAYAEIFFGLIPIGVPFETTL